MADLDRRLALDHLLLQTGFPPGLSGESPAGDKSGRGGRRHGTFLAAGLSCTATHTPGTGRGLGAVSPLSPHPGCLSGGADLPSLFLPSDLSIHLFGGAGSLRASLPLSPLSSLPREQLQELRGLEGAGVREQGGWRSQGELGIPFPVAERITPCSGDSPGAEPWGRWSSPAPLTLSGHESIPLMGCRLCLGGSPSRPPGSPAGISRDGFLPSPSCHCVPTFDQESAFLKCSISHMLR